MFGGSIHVGVCSTKINVAASKFYLQKLSVSANIVFFFPFPLGFLFQLSRKTHFFEHKK